MDAIKNLSIEIFADGANLPDMLELAKLDYICGLTTNPTLMRAAGVESYSDFAKSLLSEITMKPISFEVFSDDLDEMVLQGKTISSWGENVFVKIPVTNTKGESTALAIQKLTDQGVKVNVTAVMTVEQTKDVISSLNYGVPSNISVFAGRIADTGRDPIKIIEESLDLISSNKNIKLIWASPRELLNIFQADLLGCHIITATKDILRKLSLVGYDLELYSLDTVKMFYEDALKAKYKIEP
jgi:transaldolase